MSDRPAIMRKELSLFRKRVVRLFRQILDLSRTLDRRDLIDVAAGLVDNIHAPFLFVVVGEVKSGKSSLINALLGTEVCAVAPDPCTDVIQKIVHAPEPYEERQGQHLKEVGRPVDILKDVAIVDTPGTNSIIEQHQTITERFIPESDLVFFVFSAINPYSKTSWDLFDLVHRRWHKKIVFVLQQADRATQDELATHTVRVKEYAAERGLTDPLVFSTSARDALAKGSDPGLERIWEHIRSTVTGGRHYLLKMDSLVDTASQLMRELTGEIETQGEALQADRRERDKILHHLAMGRKTSLRDVAVFQERLVNAYNDVSGEIVQEFEEGLALTRLFKNSVKGVFRRTNSLKEWVDGLGASFQKRLTARIEAIIRETSGGMAENIALVMESLLDDLKVELKAYQVEAPKRRNISTLTRERFTVIDEVTRNLLGLLSDTAMSERLRPRHLNKLGDQAVLGGFITAVGALIAGATHAAIFDVTGGIVTTVGAFLAINTIAFKRRSVIRRFREGFAKGRTAFQSELSERLSGQVDAIYTDLEKAFAPFFENIEARASALTSLRTSADDIQSALLRERDHISSLLAS